MYTHAQMQTQIHKTIHIHTCRCTQIHLKNTNTNMPTTHAWKHKYIIHVHTSMYTKTYAHTQIHPHTIANTNPSHTNRGMHTQIYTYTHENTNTQITDRLPCAHTQIWAQTKGREEYTKMHSHTCAHTYKHMYQQVHVHVYTHFDISL